MSGLNKAPLYPPERSPHPNYTPDTSTLLHLLLFPAHLSRKPTPPPTPATTKHTHITTRPGTASSSSRFLSHYSSLRPHQAAAVGGGSGLRCIMNESVHTLAADCPASGPGNLTLMTVHRIQSSQVLNDALVSDLNGLPTSHCFFFAKGGCIQ